MYPGVANTVYFSIRSLLPGDICVGIKTFVAALRCLALSVHNYLQLRKQGGGIGNREGGGGVRKFAEFLQFVERKGEADDVIKVFLGYFGDCG